jgi:serine/threonine protein kinase
MTAEPESRSDSLPRTPASAAENAHPRHTGIRRAQQAVEQHPRSEIEGWRGRHPARIGRYTVLGQIAGGGMGSVFVAQLRGPAGFSRRVAIKCLHTRWLDDPKYVARFANEVRLTTLIRHPNVVQALDVVEEAGELFLVMDYVDGVTLAALLADLSRCERALPVGFGLTIMAAALRGLHAAHQATDDSGAPCHIGGARAAHRRWRAGRQDCLHGAGAGAG